MDTVTTDETTDETTDDDPRRAAAQLERFGWDQDLAAAFAPFALQGRMPGRVTAAHRGALEVATGLGGTVARPAGSLRHRAAAAEELPAVGDWVALEVAAGAGPALVHAVLPRRSAFVRKQAGPATVAQVVAANVDVAFLVCSLGAALNPRRLERALALAWDSGASPVVLLSKADLCERLPAAVAEAQAVAIGVPVVASSSRSGAGLADVAALLGGGRTGALLGASGVGKSSLVNALAGREVLATRPIRPDDRGRHTTTRRQLVPVPGGGLLLDTPGMRELALWGGGGLEETFDDVESLAAGCRFGDCGHLVEPGCAVRRAAEEGSLDPVRLAAWHKLQRELRAFERRHDQRAAAEERRRWRALTRSLRDATPRGRA